MARVVYYFAISLLSAAAAGALPPRDPAALQRDIAAAIAANAPSFTVLPGLYNFSALPASNPATLAITTATDFRLISGGDVEMLFPPHGGFRVLHSERIALTGPFTLDAFPPFTTQGVVSDGRRDGKWFNFSLDLDPGYDLDPSFIPSRAIFFDPATRRFLHGQTLCVTSALAAAHLGGSTWTVSVTFSCNPTLHVPDGSLCALSNNAGGPMVQIENSTSVAVSDLTSHGSPGFTLLEVGGGGNHSYTRYKVIRRPGSDRLMASTADVFHSTSVAIGPTLIDSELSFAADDLLAVHCELAILWKRINDTAFYVIDTTGQPGYGFPRAQPGEELYFYNMSEDMGRVGEASLTRFSPVTDAALIAEAQRARDYIMNVLHIDIRPFSVNLLIAHFAHPGLTHLHDYGALVELPSRCGAGTVVKNTYLHDSNGGMRLKGSRMMVQDSIVENAYGMRMLPEIFWTQSVSSNITLENNILRGCGCTANTPHAIEYNPDIVGLVLRNNTVLPANCT